MAKAFAPPAEVAQRRPRRPKLRSPQRKADLSSLSSMLQGPLEGKCARRQSAAPEPLRAGQIRSFKIMKLDADAKKIEVELA